MSSSLNQAHLQNEEAAYAYVEARIWPQGPICPHCGCTGRIYAIKANAEGRVRIGLKKCGDCRKQFTVKVGTVFEQSHVKLHLWLQAMLLLTSSKKGMSSNQLSRILGVTLKTAWFMAHRIREAMVDDDADPIGGGGKIVEVDETFLGQQQHVFRNGEGWRVRSATGQLRKIVSLVERGGRAKSLVVKTLRKDEINRAMAEASRDSHLMTDKARHYGVVGREFLSHETVDHGRDEYVRGSAHTNTVEGSFSIFKRGMRGVYQHCAEKNLHRYLAEFDFRYSNRAKLGVDDKERADRALKGISGKRLTYRTTSRRVQGEEARVVW